MNNIIMFNKLKNFKKRIFKYIFPNYYCIINNCHNKNASTKTIYIQYCHEHKCEYCTNKKFNNRYCEYHRENKCNIKTCPCECLYGYIYCSYHAATLNEYSYFMTNKINEHNYFLINKNMY